MEFIELVQKRRSIRKYKSDPIPEEKLNYILEAARFAPSWSNRQCWKYIIVTDEVLRQKILMRSEAPSVEVGTSFVSNERKQRWPRDWIAEAPIIIVGCADPTLSGNKEEKPYYLLDMGISMEHLILAAAEQGLGTCWIGGQFNEDIVKEALKIPKNIKVVALTPLGYADDADNLTEYKCLNHKQPIYFSKNPDNKPPLFYSANNICPVCNTHALPLGTKKNLKDITSYNKW